MEDTFDKVLLKVISISGKEVLKDKNRLIGYLSDLAPEYKKEVHIFSQSCSSEFLRIFYLADGGNAILRQQTVSKARHMLIEEEGLSETWADTMVNGLVYALEWKSATVSQASQKGQLGAGASEPKQKRVAMGIAVSQVGSGGHYASFEVVAVGENNVGQCEVGSWSNIVAVSCGGSHTVGVRQDGTVVAVGSNGLGQCEVGGWWDIVAVSCGLRHTVGVRQDGTVVTVGSNDNGECEVGDWRDIIAVSCGSNHTVGLRKDGTVVAVGEKKSGKCKVKAWKDIVSVACGQNYTIGLRQDGTVVATCSIMSAQHGVKAWRDIVSVACAPAYVIGLRKDGMVVVTGECTHARFVRAWRDIVSVSCGEFHSIGLKKNGTVVGAGPRGKIGGWFSLNYGQCEVGDWRDIVAISCGNNHTVGLKKV